MHRVTLDTRLDCLLERVTAVHDVTLTALYWGPSPETGRCDLWAGASSPGRSQLKSGIQTLKDADGVSYFELKRKRGSHSTTHAVLEETVAIETVLANGGAVIGPLRDRNGWEQWHLGFADADAATATLDSLDRRYELATAEQTPRSESLASLGNRCGVSDVTISKMLRCAERKLLGATVSALAGLDGFGSNPDSDSNSGPDSNSDPSSTNARPGGGSQHPNPPVLRNRRHGSR